MSNMFRTLVTFTTLAGLALFLLGALTSIPVVGLGFVMTFTSLVGWTALIGTEGNSMTTAGSSVSSIEREIVKRAS